jgi:hypothetical protein
MERKEYILEKIVPPVCVDCGQLAFYRFTITKEDDTGSQQYHHFTCYTCSVEVMDRLYKQGYTLVEKG